VNPSQISEFAELIIKRSGVHFRGSELRRLSKPCVYLFVGHRGLALYAGSSKHGIARPLGTKHHRETQQAIAECERLYVWNCETIRLAQLAERLLIKQLQPKYNKQNK
jgi:excinuclease UvrABC nuclease subunit